MALSISPIAEYATETDRTLVFCQDEHASKNLTAQLRSAHYDTDTVDSPEAACKAVNDMAFTLVVMAPPSRQAAREILVTARYTGALSRDAAIIVLAQPGTMKDLEDLLQSGASQILELDTAETRLLETVRRLCDASRRVPLRTAVWLCMIREELQARTVCQSENISDSGILIRCSTAKPRGTQFTFKLSLPGQHVSVRGRAEATRSAHRPRDPVDGFGARFLSFRHNDHQILRAFIRNREESPEALTPEDRAPTVRILS